MKRVQDSEKDRLGKEISSEGTQMMFAALPRQGRSQALDAFGIDPLLQKASVSSPNVCKTVVQPRKPKLLFSQAKLSGVTDNSAIAEVPSVVLSSKERTAQGLRKALLPGIKKPMARRPLQLSSVEFQGMLNSGFISARLGSLNPSMRSKDRVTDVEAAANQDVPSKPRIIGFSFARR